MVHSQQNESNMSDLTNEISELVNSTSKYMQQCYKPYNKTINVLDHGYVRYVDSMGTDLSIVEAARVSYASPSKGKEKDIKLLQYLIKNNHTSPLEMCKIKFNIKMPIFVMRQFVRHRMQNLNEQSARYSKLCEEFYIPEVWRAQDTKNKQGSIENEGFHPFIDGKTPSLVLYDTCHECYKIYEKMLDAGIAREQARMILPVNIYTEVYTCWDLNNLIKFLKLRLDVHAQWEIRQYAKAMYDIAYDLFPETIKAVFKDGQ